MKSHDISAFQALKNSRNARLRGDKLAARRWAVMAASLTPEDEEAWLQLATLAGPLASVGYIRQALKINPESPRARAGLVWALERVETYQSTGKAALSLPQPPKTKTTTSAIPAGRRGKSNQVANRIFIFGLLSMLVIVALSLMVFKTSSVTAFLSNPTNPSASLVQPAIFVPSTPAAPASVTAQPLLFSSTPVLETPTAAIASTPTTLPTDTGLVSASENQTVRVTNPPYFGSQKIVVSISEQHMYVYDGENQVFSFVASTGMDNATRVGNFAVLDKMPNAYGSTWDLWMPNWLGIYYSGNIENGIHALPILNNGLTLWEGYLGSPVSFGCVVLSTYDAQLLYDWVDIGTPVIIDY